LGCSADEELLMDISLLAILIAVPVIAAFVLFVLLPRISNDHDRQKKRK
jgi:hypothetical protein